MRATVEERVETLVAGRYLIIGALGEGGVAIVHRARDCASGREIALKQLRNDRRVDRERAIELFQREFHTLSQLAHPHIVAAFDYGVHEDAPYYTMELLDGGDLLDGVPYGWQAACSLARDVCSALSLIHSRRLVFRDLSPKNVRCTTDGRAKLLDFGALAPMGRAKMFVGTPAISAPEAVHQQQLDGRTDLYSLGVTLYYALTGRRPYSANRLSDLDELWKTPPAPPSKFAASVPGALDELVMELLQVDAARRPASAAETFERLGGIAGVEHDDAPHLVSSAYLSTPTLVGRDASVERFRRILKQAMTRSGGAVLVRGARGVGRSRFLDACVLEAKLCGCVVLRADGADALSGDFGVARALATQLLDAAPEAAKSHAEPKLALLRYVVPELAAPDSSTQATAPPPSPGDLQRALREWFIAVASERPVCIAVDDVHRADLPSAALVALLAREATDHRFLAVATIPSDDSFERSSALDLFEQESRSISLSRLSAARTEQLLGSLFGDVPNVELVATRLHTLSGGLPRDLMQLAQHLVDRGVARYTAGSWSFPRDLEARDLPADMTQARRAKIETLGEAARTVAQAFALDRIGRFSLGECVVLGGEEDVAKAMLALDELVAAEIVILSGDDYCLSGLGFREPLLQCAAPELRRLLCERLARVYARRPGAGVLQAAYLFDAGEETRGLEVLVEFSATTIRSAALSIAKFTELLQSLPNDWLSVFDRALALCDQLRRPSSDAFTLRVRISGFASQLVMDAVPYYAPLFQEAQREVQVSLCAADVEASGSGEAMPLDGAAAPKRAVASAAIMQLGQLVAGALGCAANSLSMELVQLLPDLSPYSHLVPALALWQTLISGVRARLSGRTDVVRGIYERQLARLEAPNHGMDETYRLTQINAISHALGMIEASMGLAKALDRAALLDGSILHEANALRLRMLYAVWQGDVADADKFRKQAEVLTLERARRQANEGAHLTRELLGLALMDDLTRVKRTIDAIEPLSYRAPGWKTVLHWAKAEYQRIRGDTAAALVHAEEALASMNSAGHPVWAEAASVRVRLLFMQGRLEEAVDAGAAYLAEAERRDIVYERNYIRLPFALALARAGRIDDAEAVANAAIASLLELGATGLNLGLAYETRARVAMCASKKSDFDQYQKLCGVHYRTASAGPLAARYERLLREERRANDSSEALQTLTSARASTVSMSTSRIADRLESSGDPAQRARAALELLLEESGAAEGFLLRFDGAELTLRGHIGQGELSESLLARAEKYVLEQTSADDVTLITESDGEMQSTWVANDGHVYSAVLLSHEEEASIAVTGLALLRTRPGMPFRHTASTAAYVSRLVWQTNHLTPTQS